MNNKKHLISEVKRLIHILIHIYETCNDSSLAKDYAVHLMRHHARYFVEQAERVEELLKAHELKDLEHQGLVNQLKEKDEQNKRYRESIKFAIEESRWGNEGTALDRVVAILKRLLEDEE